MTCDKKGVALVLVLTVIAVLSVLGTAIVSRTINEANLVTRHAESAQAFWLAEAGINQALLALNNSDWSGWAGTTTKTYEGSMAYYGDYDITITDADGENPQISAVGSSPNRDAVNLVSRTVNALIKQESFEAAFGVFGDTAVTMSGNGETDSYSSSDGAYGGINVGTNGDVATNGTGNGSVSLSGNATVNGDVSTGPGGTVELSGTAAINGETSDNADEEMGSVEVPSALIDLSSSGSYSKSGSSSGTISSGSYKYSSLSVSGNATVTISGTVNLYLTGSSSLSISGNGQLVIPSGSSLNIYSDGTCDISGNGITNNTNVPSNLVIYSTYTSSNGISISGNGDLAGVVYAPDTSIAVTGNGNIYGALAADNVSITGNGDVHYDEALSDLALSSGGYSIEAWQDMQNPYDVSS